MRPRKPLSRRRPKERTAKDKAELKERLKRAKDPKMLNLTQALLKNLGRGNLVKMVDKGYSLPEIKKMLDNRQLTKENIGKIPEKKER